MNKVILMGNLTRDPEYHMGNNPEQRRCNFSIAVGRRYKREGQPDADFFNCTAFGGTAEFVDKYFRKGQKIMVVGRLQNNNYKTQNGENVYSVGVLVEEVEFCERKSEGTEGNNGSSREETNGFMNIPDGLTEDLPFA